MGAAQTFAPKQRTTSGTSWWELEGRGESWGGFVPWAQSARAEHGGQEGAPWRGVSAAVPGASPGLPIAAPPTPPPRARPLTPTQTHLAVTLGHTGPACHGAPEIVVNACFSKITRCPHLPGLAIRKPRWVASRRSRRHRSPEDLHRDLWTPILLAAGPGAPSGVARHRPGPGMLGVRGPDPGLGPGSALTGTPSQKRAPGASVSPSVGWGDSEPPGVQPGLV